jgi:hypothetical protein
MNTERAIPTPTISRVCPDGTMIEILYDADLAITSLAACDASGEISIEAQVDLPTGERLVPYAPSNNLLTSGCVLLSSEVGEFQDKAALLEQVRAFIHRYVDLSPLYEEIAAHYVLLSWVHDASTNYRTCAFAVTSAPGRHAPCSPSGPFHTSRSSRPARPPSLRYSIFSTSSAARSCWTRRICAFQTRPQTSPKSSTTET